MRVTGYAAILGLLLAAMANGQTPPAQPAPGAPPARLRAWVPKKSPYAAYVAPNRLWWKMADVLVLHRGQKSWSQPIVRTRDIVADWHQIAPGAPTPTLAYADNRTAIIVWDGEIRVAMDGQAPFVARKGFEIDIPFRVPFTLEASGDRPGLYLEIHAADDMPLYPVATTPTRPPAADGFIYEQRLASGGPGGFDAVNRPYLDYYKDVVDGGARAGTFIAAQRLFVNNIRGRATETPPSSNLGHFHVGYDEFWFVMEGNVTLQVEGQAVFTASPGDVIAAAQGRWHRASFGGRPGQMGTRVAVNPYPQGLHGYTIESGAHQ